MTTGDRASVIWERSRSLQGTITSEGSVSFDERVVSGRGVFAAAAGRSGYAASAGGTSIEALFRRALARSGSEARLSTPEFPSDTPQTLTRSEDDQEFAMTARRNVRALRRMLGESSVAERRFDWAMPVAVQDSHRAYWTASATSTHSVRHARAFIDLRSRETSIADIEVDLLAPDLNGTAARVEEQLEEFGALCRRPRREVGEGPVDLLFPGYLGALVVHEVLGHLAEQDDARPSWLADRMERALVDSSMTVRDVPVVDGVGDFSVDALGGTREEITLIERGTLVGLIDGRTAQPTPWLPLAAQDVRHSPRARMANTVVSASTREPVPADVVVCELVTLASVDHSSGECEIQIGRASHREHGERVAIVRPFSVRGNAIDILAGLTPIADASAGATRLSQCGGTSGVIPVGFRSGSLLVRGVRGTATAGR